MQPAHTEVYSSRRISKEGTVSSPLFPPPGASHFLSNATLIKIEPIPHRCSDRDTGDNNTPFHGIGTCPLGGSGDHPWKEPSVLMVFIYFLRLYTPFFEIHLTGHCFAGAAHQYAHRLHEIKSLKCSMTASQVAAFLVASTEADEVSQ